MDHEDTTLEQAAVEASSGGEQPEDETLLPAPASLAEPAPAGLPTPAAAPGEDVTASGCAACGPSLVYALGQLDYDFGTEARRDSFIQQGLGNPHDPAALLEHLSSSPSHATAVTWTLVQDTTPIYAIAPAGPFAAETYAALREFLQEQINGDVERVSIPGWSRASVRLMNGQVVPQIVPELRGMYSWTTEALVKTLQDVSPNADGVAEVSNFLARVYHEIRNLGVTPQERAINYAATNAFQVHNIFNAALKDAMKLDSIAFERSPICRPESDCWDVKLTFFNPSKRLEQARKVYRFTIDVSDVVPVTVGTVRHWDVY